MKRIIIFFIFINILIFSLLSQNNIDSLQDLLQQTKDIDTKVRLYLQLISVDTTEKLHQEAKDYIYDLRNNEKKIDYLLNLGIIFLRKNKRKQAISVYQYTYKIADKINKDSLRALALHKLGNAYLYDNNYDSAIISYLQSLDLRQKLADIQGIAGLTNNLGVIYWKMEDYNKALEYYKKSLKYFMEIKDTDGIQTEYNNIGACFYENDVLDSSKYYYLKSMDLAKKLKKYKSIATLLLNLGSIEVKKKNYKKAINTYLKTFEYKDHQSIRDLVTVYNNLGYCYTKLKKYDSADYYLNKALALAKEHKLEDKLYRVYFFKSQYFDALKNIDSAYIYIIKYINLKDSIKSIEVQKQLKEIQTKYQVSKKEQQIAIERLKYQKEKLKNTLLISFILVFLLLTIILLFLIKKMRKQNIILKQQKAEILQQKEEILTQAEQLHQAYDSIKRKNQKIEEQNKLITEVNNQLKDSIQAAEHIQAAMLPFEENYGKYFETFIIYRPKDIVSGDFYWFSRYPIEYQGHRYLFAAVVDCTGHGVPGAFMSMIGFRMFDDLILTQKIISPAAFLAKLDQLVRYALKQDVSHNNNGMDVAIARFEKIDQNTIEVVYSGAKRNLVYFDNKSKKLIEVKGVRRSIAGGKQRRNINFENNAFKTMIDSVFYMFSDGITDQNNKERIRLGTPRLYKILSEIAHLPLEEQKRILEDQLDKWMEGTFQRDDITFVGLKIKK